MRGDVAAALGYKRADVAIYKNVDARDKRTLSALSVANIEMRSAYSNPRKGVGLEKDNIDVAFARNTAATIYINLSGVNALVFGSKLAAARAFKHWVTSDVLPAIQRTGEYRQSTDDRGREDHSDAVDPASATNPIDLRAENEKLRVQLAVERATAELRAEVATLRAKPTGVNDPVEVARVYADVTKTYAMVATSDCFSAIDKIFFHDRLKNSLAGASTCALLAVDTTPGAAPKTTDRLLVPLSEQRPQSNRSRVRSSRLRAARQTRCCRLPRASRRRRAAEGRTLHRRRDAHGEPRRPILKRISRTRSRDTFLPTPPTTPRCFIMRGDVVMGAGPVVSIFSQRHKPGRTRTPPIARSATSRVKSETDG
jgi:prophage antirepressor-like protein